MVILASPNTVDHSGEVEVGGDQHPGKFVEIRQQLEQQCPACLAEEQVVQVVEDRHVNSHLPAGNPASFALCF